MFNVEIQAEDRSWFVADEGENLSPEAADKLVNELRAKGFKVRAVFAEGEI